MTPAAPTDAVRLPLSVTGKCKTSACPFGIRIKLDVHEGIVYSPKSHQAPKNTLRYLDGKNKAWVLQLLTPDWVPTWKLEHSIEDGKVLAKQAYVVITGGRIVRWVPRKGERNGTNRYSHSHACFDKMTVEEFRTILGKFEKDWKETSNDWFLLPQPLFSNTNSSQKRRLPDEEESMGAVVTGPFPKVRPLNSRPPADQFDIISPNKSRKEMLLFALDHRHRISSLTQQDLRELPVDALVDLDFLFNWLSLGSQGRGHSCQQRSKGLSFTFAGVSMDWRTARTPEVGYAWVSIERSLGPQVYGVTKVLLCYDCSDDTTPYFLPDTAPAYSIPWDITRPKAITVQYKTGTLREYMISE
ncbi:hypothetical protein HDV00_009999 [Rhizophlyctis rosea]|nr:hypothetical protein HDV00_009999 [Rhizophlyctis rosea]